MEKSRSILFYLLAWLLSFLPCVGYGEESALIVKLKALHSVQGTVECSIWKSKEGYPTEKTRAVETLRVPIGETEPECRFHVPPGAYAVAAFHDENNDGKLDKNFLGIPTEGHAASNDANGHMGPPSFDDARFEYKGGILKIVVKMVY